MDGDVWIVAAWKKKKKREKWKKKNIKICIAWWLYFCSNRGLKSLNVQKNFKLKNKQMCVVT